MTTGGPDPTATFGIFTPELDELWRPTPSSHRRAKKPRMPPMMTRGLLRARFFKAGGRPKDEGCVRAA
jgi:hypothetical protein